jgi:GTP-binding protein HflX
VILADTVGFIQNLPHDLVDAFHATLQETIEADLLLHVVDASDEQKSDHIEQVNQVLKHIEADKCPQILIFNKIDQTQCLPHVDIGEDKEIHRVWISALKNQGLNLLTSGLESNILNAKNSMYSSVSLWMSSNCAPCYTKIRQS